MSPERRGRLCSRLFLYHKEYAYSYTFHTWYTIQVSYEKTLKA